MTPSEILQLAGNQAALKHKIRDGSRGLEPEDSNVKGRPVLAL
jgi:hypothetical protein